MTKNIISLLVTFVFSFVSFAQENGSVSGKITSTDNSGLDDATVTINGTKFGTKTNAAGEFEIKNIKPGNYVLKASHVSFKSKETSFSIVANQNTTIPSIVLNTTNEVLSEIVVKGNINKYSKSESDYVSRMKIKNLENSQVYNTVTKELIKDQLVTNQDEALKNIPGLYQLWAATGRAGDGGSFFASRGFVTQSLVRNGIAGKITNNVDASNLERIESIKGPSATLFGNVVTSYGGLINRVTKKPYAGFGGEIAYQTGSYGFNRLTADVNTTLNNDETAQLRVNGAYTNGNTFQDYGYSKSYFFAPSFSYKVNERLTIAIDAEISNVDASSMPLIYIPYGSSPSDIGFNHTDGLNMNFKRSFTGDEFIINTKTMNVFAQANYQISDNWTSQSILSSSTNKSEGLQSWMYLLGNDTMSRNAWSIDGRDNILEFQQNFNGDFNIGSIRNRFLIGGDILNSETKSGYGYLNGGFFKTDFDTVNYSGALANYYDFNPTNVNNALVGGGKYNQITSFTTFSAYVADVINITDNLIVSAAVRFDHYNNKGLFDPTTGETVGDFSQNAFSPKFGLVYQIVKDQVSVFGNYQNSFKNIGYVQTAEGVTEKFKPEQANQIEGGIKLNVFQNKLSANISYYNILVEDIQRSNGMFAIQDGNQKSKGFEIELTGNPVPGLNFLIGYAKNDSELEKANADVNGLRPETAGPENLINYWISYNLQTTKLKGLGFGFGGNYADQTYMYNRRKDADSPVETFTLPSYAVINATINYDQPKYRFSLKMNNITDELYFNGYSTINVQNPRTVMGSVTYKF